MRKLTYYGLAVLLLAGSAAVPPAFTLTCDAGNGCTITCEDGCGCMRQGTNCWCRCSEPRRCGGLQTLDVDIKDMPLGDALGLVSAVAESGLEFEFLPSGLAHRRVSFTGSSNFVELILNLLAQADANPLLNGGEDFCTPGGRIRVTLAAAKDNVMKGKKTLPPMDSTLSVNMHGLNSFFALSLAAEAAGVEIIYPSTLAAKPVSMETDAQPWLSALDGLAKAAGAKGAKIAPSGIVEIEQ